MACSLGHFSGRSSWPLAHCNAFSGCLFRSSPGPLVHPVTLACFSTFRVQHVPYALALNITSVTASPLLEPKYPNRTAKCLYWSHLRSLGLSGDFPGPQPILPFGPRSPEPGTMIIAGRQADGRVTETAASQLQHCCCRRASPPQAGGSQGSCEPSLAFSATQRAGQVLILHDMLGLVESCQILIAIYVVASHLFDSACVLALHEFFDVTHALQSRT